MMPRGLPTILLALGALAGAPQEEEGFRPLFNGKDLAGWVRVNTAPSTWTIEDGLLVCSGKPIGELRTTRMFQNFILELEWRHMVPKGNSGVFVWADDITARGQPFHRGIEVQVLENAYGNTRHYTTHGDIFPIHGAKMTPVNGRGGGRAFPTEERSRPSPQWNHYRVTCEDGAISLAVNGKVVTKGTDCSPRKGYLCLESEGGIVHFRNIRIKELPETPIDPAHVATADRGYRCLYTGVDLSGWAAAEGSGGRWAPKDWILAYDGKASAAGHPALATEEAFGDIGFIFDVRFPEASGTARVFLRGSDKVAIAVDPADPSMAGHLAKPGGWNRFEGAIRGERLALSLNGNELFKDRAVPGVPPRGPIRILPGGAVELANVYVRELKD